MKRLLLLAFLFLTLNLMGQQRVMVVEIDEEIDAGAWRHLKGALGEAKDNTDLFIVKLNTYGGAVDMADSMRSALMACPIPTVAFIDHNAASAGALIALSCDSAYMAPGSSIGAATVVNGNGEPMPQKFQSYWSTVMRSTAAAHGKYIAQGDTVARWRRSPELAADMVNPEKALSFTTEEALEVGLIDGVVSRVNEIPPLLGMEHAEISYYTPSGTDTFMGFLASAGVRAILILLILGGIYFEMQTPGLGVAGAVSSVAAVLYFLPMLVAGSLPLWVVVLFLIGVVALVLEVFVIPGFGIAGIGGICAISISLIFAMVNPGWENHFELSLLTKPIIIFLCGLLAAVGAVWFLTSRFGPVKVQKMSALMHEQKVEDGYLGVASAPAELIGKTGVALTDLRPAGKVSINGDTYDASSTGAFISRGTPIKVVKYQTATIFVKRLD